METIEKEKMWLSNQNLINFVISQKFSHFSHIKDELFSEGQWGLWKAVDTYDNKRKFSTYAYLIIKREILMFLRKESNTVIHESLDRIICEDKTEDEENPIRNYFSICENIESIENKDSLMISEIRKFGESKNLNKREIDLIELLYRGYEIRDISKMSQYQNTPVKKEIEQLQRRLSIYREEMR